MGEEVFVKGKGTVSLREEAYSARNRFRNEDNQRIGCKGTSEGRPLERGNTIGGSQIRTREVRGTWDAD